jgi:hypothetical protein
MRSNLQLYLEAITAVLLMSTIGVISGFIAAVITEIERSPSPPVVP